MEEQLSKKLVEEAAVLESFKDWQTLHFMNWNKRNEVMAENILRFIDNTKAKRVVVFTGILHKPYLSAQLSATQKKLHIVEYFEP